MSEQLAASKSRALPSVDRLLRSPGGGDLMRRYARAYVVDAVRAEIEELRARSRSGEAIPGEAAIVERVQARLARDSAPRLRRVINASGIILHTNLGRAELAPEAVSAVTAAAGMLNLEYDLEAGGRGQRDQLIAADLCALTGAEAAIAVNNNAAAVLLTLNTLASNREVIVSRGELIEIGGSFRIPEVLSKSNAHLREVGTTNRTRPSDYENAVTPATGVLLKVHPSNYRVVGFTASVSLRQLVEIGRAHGVPVVEDLGSGALIDLSAYGLPREPIVADSVAAGADVVTFSGDKLLGGPQAGLIVGRQRFVHAINTNPLKRALRCDKLTLAALAATLHLYRRSPALTSELPTLRWLTRPLAEIEQVAREAIPLLRQGLGPAYHFEVTPGHSQVGAGALPNETLPTRVIAITHPRESPNDIAARFRRSDPPVIGRIQENRFLLDVRTVACAADLRVAFAPPAAPAHQEI